jgi:cell wall assembly regulator SMI1
MAIPSEPDGASQALWVPHWPALNHPHLEAIWNKLETWLVEHQPQIAASLRPAASEAALASFEASIGQALPAEVRAVYQRHDGQRDQLSLGMYFGMIFMSLEYSLGHWQMWASVIDSFSQQDMDNLKPFGSYPRGMIKPLYASKAWIPLMSDGNATNGLAIDLDPDAKGIRGQIISYGRDEREHYVVAPSITHLFDQLAIKLELGEYGMVEFNGERSLAPPSATLLGSLHWTLAYLRNV